MTSRRIEAMANTFRAFGCPMRLQLLSLLGKGPMPVSVLVTTTGRPQPTVSHHLSILRLNGIVTTERRGKAVIYRINPDNHHVAAVRKVAGLIGAT